MSPSETRPLAEFCHVTHSIPKWTKGGRSSPKFYTSSPKLPMSREHTLKSYGNSEPQHSLSKLPVSGRSTRGSILSGRNSTKSFKSGRSSLNVLYNHAGTSVYSSRKRAHDFSISLGARKH